MKKPRFTRLNVDKKIINIAILAAIFTIIFLASILTRIYIFKNNSLPGEDVYFVINNAKDIFSFQKNFVIEQRAIQELIWPGIIALFSFLLRVPVEFSALLLSLIFGILSVILIYFIIDKIGFKKRNMALAFFLISPATIWIFSTANKFILPFFFSLLILYLLLFEKLTFAFILMGITSLFGLVSSISALSISVLSFKKGWIKNWFLKALSIAFIINVGLYLLFPFTDIINFNAGNIFSMFSSLSEFGVSLFAFLLSVIGIVMTWKERKERRELSWIFLAFALLFIFSIINKEFVFFFNFILIFLAVIGFVKLLERNWASGLIRNLTLVILVIGLLFPLVFMPLRIASSPPDEKMIDSLDYLKSEEDGRVLSIEENGYWIRAFSGKEPFIDDFKAKVKPKIKNETIDFLMERNVDKLREGFSKEDIKYIFLDKRTSEIFRTEDEGILLLLKQKDLFNKIYENDEVSIWKFLE